MWSGMNTNRRRIDILKKKECQIDERFLCDLRLNLIASKVHAREKVYIETTPLKDKKKGGKSQRTKIS